MPNAIDIQGWFYPQDIEYYRATIEALPDKSKILEIGCWKGRSICSVADIIKRKNIIAYVMDTFLGSENEQDTFHADAKNVDIEAIFRKNVEEFDIVDNIRLIRADTRTFEWADFEDNFFDFIFIDGQHTADAVAHDIRKCLPKVKVGGLLAGHDLVLPGVKLGVENVFQGDYVIETESGNIWEKKKIKENNVGEKVVLISCWAKPLRNGGWNAKNPSKEWWQKLVKLLKDKGYVVEQCGQGPEIKLKLADRHLWDMDLWALGEKIKKCDAWISIDNFFHHWALLQFRRPGVVIWGQSDPEIFGHKENINLLKDQKHLRPKQYEMWESATYDKDVFVEPEIVAAEIEKSINKGEERSE